MDIRSEWTMNKHTKFLNIHDPHHQLFFLQHYQNLQFFLIRSESTRLNSSHTEIYTLSLHDALPICSEWTMNKHTKFLNIHDPHHQLFFLQHYQNLQFFLI